MKIKILIFLLIFDCSVTSLLGQQDYSPGKIDPVETSFTPDSELFAGLLSMFSVRCQQYDTLFPLFSPSEDQLDDKYTKILMRIPFFRMYPAFRIDCPNGYVLALFNCYMQPLAFVGNLEILSYDLKGRIISRMSLAYMNMASYWRPDQKQFQQFQLLSRISIVNGEIHYDVVSRSFMNEKSTSSQNNYRYKIRDDATLELLPVEYLRD